MGVKKITQREIIARFKEKFGDRFDYSKVEYVNAKAKVCIICPEHGEFLILPDHFLRSRHGCPRCAWDSLHEQKRYSKEKFIEKAIEAHGSKYDYSKVEYSNNNTDVCIVCPIHGEFLQLPFNHLRGQGCPKCVGKKQTTDSFIEKARKIHGCKYDYSKVEYINAETKVCIICPEHGEFWQIPNTHRTVADARTAATTMPSRQRNSLKKRIRCIMANTAILRQNIPIQQRKSQ